MNPNAYDFAGEARRVCDAIGADRGWMTVQTALREAFTAGAQAHERPPSSLDGLLDAMATGHGDGQMHAIADVNDGKVDDLIGHRLRQAYVAAFSHPATEKCIDAECSMCAMRDCPDHEPLHYHHDGCPCCTQDRDR